MLFVVCFVCCGVIVLCVVLYDVCFDDNYVSVVLSVACCGLSDVVCLMFLCV